MMCYVTCVGVSLALLFAWSTTLASAVNLVGPTCSKISQSEPNVKYDFCVAALGSNPRSATANLEQLCEISFELGVSRAKSISKSIKNLLKNPRGLDRFQKDALGGCLELYSYVPDDLDSGLKALKQGDYNTANIQVSGAMTNADTCEDGFRERKEFSPLTKDNKEFIELAAISLVFTTFVQH